MQTDFQTIEFSFKPFNNRLISNRMLKFGTGLLCIRSCRIARSLSDPGRGLPIRPLFTNVSMLLRPSVAEHFALIIAEFGIYAKVCINRMQVDSFGDLYAAMHMF